MAEDPPRYRIEHRRFGLPPLVLGFADALAPGTSQLWRAAWRLGRAGETGSVVLVDQKTEQDVAAREIARRPTL